MKEKIVDNFNRTKIKHPYLVRYLILISVSTLINMIGSGINHILPIQLHLDTIGTVLSALVGGYLPSVFTVLITSTIKECVIYREMYYSFLSMITAIFTSLFARKIVNRGKKTKVVLLIPILAVLTGIGNAAMSWFLCDAKLDLNANPFVGWFHNNANLSDFMTLSISAIITEFIDKSITVMLAIGLFYLMPKYARDGFRHPRIWQNKLSDEIEENIRKINCKKRTMRVRISIIMNGSTLVIAVFALLISFSMYSNNIIDEHIKAAKGATDVIVGVINENMIDTYLKDGKDAPGYSETEKMLYLIKDSYEDIEYVYVYRILEDGCHVVFDLDTNNEKGASPNEIEEFDVGFKESLSDLIAGREVEPIITNDSKYGYLLTLYTPMYDSNGICKCYVCVDYSMKDLGKYWNTFIIKYVYMLGVIMILEIVVTQWVIDRSIVYPINTLSYITSMFAYNSEEVRYANVKRLESLDIRTGDEIENLYHALTKTTKESTENVSDIQKKSEEITQIQKGLIMSLAELVESRDKSTGAHIKKTSLYVEIITKEMKKRGYYAEEMNDEFCQNVIDAAPLHDIGKIHVPDSILTKPGKLTDEEYEIMKTHAEVGGQILMKVMEIVKSGYLKEARKMAEYHHEKWNGTGYPHKVSGEDIPLCARIMAVADVFDALVSKRCYKDAMSFDEAINIIKEDSSKHFDPLVVEAFIAVQDEVKEITKKFEN